MTICTVGTEDDKKMAKPPFSYFGELTAAGVKTVWCNPDQLAAMPGRAAHLSLTHKRTNH